MQSGSSQYLKNSLKKDNFRTKALSPIPESPPGSTKNQDDNTKTVAMDAFSISAFAGQIPKQEEKKKTHTPIPKKSALEEEQKSLAAIIKFLQEDRSRLAKESTELEKRLTKEQSKLKVELFHAQYQLSQKENRQRREQYENWQMTDPNALNYYRFFTPLITTAGATLGNSLIPGWGGVIGGAAAGFIMSEAIAHSLI